MPGVGGLTKEQPQQFYGSKLKLKKFNQLQLETSRLSDLAVYIFKRVMSGFTNHPIVSCVHSEYEFYKEICHLTIVICEINFRCACTFIKSWRLSAHEHTRYPAVFAAKRYELSNVTLYVLLFSHWQWRHQVVWFDINLSTGMANSVYRACLSFGLTKDMKVIFD